MVDANVTTENVEVSQEVQATEVAEVVKPKFTSLEEAAKRVEELEAEQSKNAELLKKVRKYERENKEAADAALHEQGKYKELYEAELNKRTEIETKMKTKLIDSAISEVLKDAKVKSVSTVLKLIDKSKIAVENDEVNTDSIKTLIKELKQSDPILFEGPEEAPAVKRATEGTPVGGFEKELRGAKSQKEIEAVMKKYHKL